MGSPKVLLFLWLCNWKRTESQPGSTVTSPLREVALYFEAPLGRRWGHCLKSLSPHKRTPATAWRVVEAALCPKPPRAARARTVAVGRLTGERLPVAGATWWLSSTSCQDEQSSARLLEAEWAGAPQALWPPAQHTPRFVPQAAEFRRPLPSRLI